MTNSASNPFNIGDKVQVAEAYGAERGTVIEVIGNFCILTTEDDCRGSFHFSDLTPIEDEDDNFFDEEDPDLTCPNNHYFPSFWERRQQAYRNPGPDYDTRESEMPY